MSKHQKGSKVNKYLTTMAPILFDDLKGAISQRIEGYDFYEKWYVLVPFSLFALRMAHFYNTDDEIHDSVNLGIDYYLDDDSNKLSYINYFGNKDFFSNLIKPPKKNLINDVNVYMSWYINEWNKAQNGGDDRPDIVVSMVFGENIATDSDRRHVTLAFDYLYKRFKNGVYNYFEL